ncbi:MAG: hypothetical protein NTX64_07210 [Elusimicrobia bacterium]|nr:hypothetical protein [Elusimicrobiota bacterium]
MLTGERRGDGEAVEAGFASDALPLSESGLSRLAPADDEPGAGAAEPRVGAAEITPAPPAASPQDRRNIRLMNFGTGFWKFGAEAVAVGVPLAALHLFGGATFVAGLAVMYGMSQIVSSSVAIGLVERAPPSRVLAGAVAVQAAIVASIFALASAGLLSAWMIFPLYALIGAAHGVAETARRLVPGWILGHDEAALQRYNGGLHVFYEIAGIAGAIAAGAVVLMSSPLAALILEPPAAIIAAFLFSRVHADFEPAPPAPRAGSFGTWAAASVRGYFADVRQGAAAIFKDPKLAWAALAMIVPAAVHRILEGVLLPVFASKVLALPAAAAWLLSASDTGELLGALLLLAAGSRVKGSSGWVRLMSLGLLAGWIFSVTTSLPLVITLVVASSLTWAASDLSLLSYLQARLPDDVESRAMGFLVGLTVLAMTLGSLGAGRLLDAAGAGTGFVVIGAVLTALAAGLLWVSRKLRQKAGAGSGPRAGNIRQ